MSKTFFALVNGVQMTVKQHAILCRLREARLAGDGPVTLPINNGFDDRTLKMLSQRDWIIESWKLFNERRFAITGRGLAALAEAEAPSKKPPAGEMCFQCGQQPRYVSPKGLRSAYCRDHHNAYNRARYAARGGGHGYRPELPCGRCHEKPRAVSPKGHVYGQCSDCRRLSCAESRQRRLARMRTAIADGNAPLCVRCGRNPIHVSARVASTTCKYCNNSLRSQRARAEKVRRMAEKMGLRKR